MANSFTLSTTQKIYEVVIDRTGTFQLLTFARLQSVTGAPIVLATLTADHPDLFVKFSDGFICLAGLPDRVVPQLATQPATFSVTVTASYHQPLTVPLTIPAGSTLPYTQPAPVALRYEPVRIQGQVKERNGSLTVSPDAVVTSNDRAILVLRTPLQAGYDTGATVNPVTLTPIAVTPAPRLFQPAAQNDSSLIIENRSTLNPGDVLQLGPAVSQEYVVVDALVGSPAVTGEVRTILPLRRSWPANTAVSPTTVASAISPSNPARTLVHPVQVGDGLLTLNALTPNPTVTAVEVVGAAPTSLEHHLVGALSDAAGVYRLDGIHQHGTLDLHAENSAGTHSQDVLWTVDVRRRVNVVNFQLTV